MMALSNMFVSADVCVCDVGVYCRRVFVYCALYVSSSN